MCSRACHSVNVEERSPRSTTQAVPRARGSGLALPVGGAGRTTIRPAAAAARRGGWGSPGDCPYTRSTGWGCELMLSGSAQNVIARC